MDWGFYGRHSELKRISEILNRNRWFFAQITGRRRIGKTRLIQRALEDRQVPTTFYVQIPDSDPAGVVAAVLDQMEVFGLDEGSFKNPTSLSDVAKLVANLIRKNYLVALDEFQYFNRPKLREFCSHLQREVDQLSIEKGIKGGLFVLGSIHADMSAILDDKGAPLFNRTTDEISVPHWDFSSLQELLKSFEVNDPLHLLFLWNLFEGVPKFYRDCFEQGVLNAKDRKSLLTRMFFESSSPLKSEADNWFLKELHGRYDTILRYIARNAGCTNSDLEAHIRQVSGESKEQVGGHLKILSQRFGLIQKKQPIFAKAKERKGRYYITDNFLRSWLGALAAPVSSVSFSPVDRLVAQADERLKKMEGFALEKLSTLLYEERSRKGIGNFSLSERIDGFWDRSDVEIDLVAVDKNSNRIRFITCKRNENEIVSSILGLRAGADIFIRSHKQFSGWAIEYGAISPIIGKDVRNTLQRLQVHAEDFEDLFSEL